MAKDKRLIGNKPEITVERTEQWEYTAYGYGMFSTASSEEMAELYLLRKVVKQLEGIIESFK